MVGIGALDAHATRLLFGAMTLFSYDMLFKTVLTYVLAQPMTGETDRDLGRFYEALSAGHAFVCYAPQGDARGFTFRCEGADANVIMGDEVVWQGGLQLVVEVPEKARVRLLCDGRLVAEAATDTLEHAADAPGVYRVEVRRDDEPWIFSNPIYLRNPA